MNEILHIGLDYPPNYFNLGDLLGDGKMAMLTISMCNDMEASQSGGHADRRTVPGT